MTEAERITRMQGMGLTRHQAKQVIHVADSAVEAAFMAGNALIEKSAPPALISETMGAFYAAMVSTVVTMHTNAVTILKNGTMQ